MEALPSTVAYLFGRHTYDELAAFWPFQSDDSPMAAHLNHTTKYVATHQDKPLDWANSRRLDGDLIEAVTRLKATVNGNIAVLGSGNLVEQLLDADLPDAFALFVHPLVLGGGRQLFPRHDRQVSLNWTTRAEHRPASSCSATRATAGKPKSDSVHVRARPWSTRRRLPRSLPGDVAASGRVVEAAAAPPLRPAGFQAAGQLRIGRRDDARLAARVRETFRATRVPLRRGS